MLLLSDKEIFGIISSILSLVAFLPYIWLIFKGKIRPNLFSRVIFFIVSGQIAFGIYFAGGGAGSWPLFITFFLNIFIIIGLFKTGADRSIKKHDYIFLLMSIIAVPIWIITKDPTWSVVILSIQNSLGYGPAYTQSYRKPFDESIFHFSVIILRDIILVFALHVYSLGTLIFPILKTISAIALVTLIIIRRRQLGIQLD